MKILTIIITYNPDILTLKKLITSLQSQNLDSKISNDLIIIDNKSNNTNEIHNLKVNAVYLDKNIGIASAQNIGLEKAVNETYDFVLLSDQDTSYPTDYINSLINHITDDVASIGSMFFNKTTSLREGYVKKISFKGFDQPQSGIHSASFTIASGTIINVTNLKKIGLMKEELFIDYVDIEWCLRARSKGFNVLINADTLLEHSIGEKTIKFMGNTYPDRSPLRMYFLVRNGIYLCSYNKTLDFSQKSVIIIKTFLYTFCYSSRGDQKLKKLKYCLKGLYHGLIKEMGNPL